MKRRMPCRFSKSFSVSDTVSIGIRVPPSVIDIQTLAGLLLGEIIFPRLIVTGNEEDDAEGQEVMGTDIDVPLSAECSSFSYSPSSYSFRLSVKNDAKLIDELEGIRGRNGYIQFGE